ncbi:very-long-chain 3-oxoacyl-CoA reductase-B [Camelus dromedarius]|uniref:17beta-estradiol 17-dehydrogenase n=2 Tax=Camelus TaxID=9836 RepID=A0A8B7K6G3_CAMFR|nr:very-long-chain 3-oxoacyl-CoA reductase-B-like isoform X1 [Camelus bactrianus]XP_010985905.1 very-long-chain 3-oxoacyl-CoA reductase-B-like isoform X3 [Camelus dromedarius]XP_014407313.1 very-long-chain 3-oxoacyl-CoA reductase-B [Camelus ferus]
MESEWDALRVLGAVTAVCLLLWVTWGLVYTVYVYLLPQARRGAPWLRAHGAWAVVTGATSGIGRAYAHELARRGLNIVLISRDPSKLEHEAKEIERLYGRSTRVIQADFTGGLEIYEPIEAGLKDLEIGILVNNVAKQYADNLGKLLDFEDTAQKLSDIINCNMMSVVQMTRIVLPQMVTRRKGIIINISSIVDRNPFPFIAMYGATKAFVRSFSASLKAEYSSEGVLVQTVSPFIVETNMTLAMKNRFLVVNAHDFARQALDTLGLTSYTPGCLRHALQGLLLAIFLPSWFCCSREGVKLLSLFANWSREQSLPRRTR